MPCFPSQLPQGSVTRTHSTPKKKEHFCNVGAKPLDVCQTWDAHWHSACGGKAKNGRASLLRQYPATTTTSSILGLATPIPRLGTYQCLSLAQQSLAHHPLMETPRIAWPVHCLSTGPLSQGFPRFSGRYLSLVPVHCLAWYRTFLRRPSLSLSGGQPASLLCQYTSRRGTSTREYFPFTLGKGDLHLDPPTTVQQPSLARVHLHLPVGMACLPAAPVR